MQLRGATGLTNWEFQYAIPDTAFSYRQTNEGLEGELQCELLLVGEQNDTIADHWLVVGLINYNPSFHRQHFTGVRTLELRPGTYQVHLTVLDLVDTNRSLTSVFQTTVRAFGLRIDLSDIMFVADSSNGTPPAFRRNGMSAIPNPRREMIGSDPSVSMYLECYQTKVNKADTVVLKFEVLDFAKRDIITSYVKLEASADGLAIREDIPGSALRTGVYTLVVTAVSRDLQTVFATQEKRFYVLNPELPPEGTILVTEEQRFLNSEWAVCEGARLDLELELSNVLATRAEKLTLEGLQDVRAKQRYLYRFWSSRDPDPQTEVNERLDEFREMYKRAQTFFGSAAVKDGWRTDRGITLLKYGVPTQVVQHIQTMDTKPYEEWLYQNLQGGVHFYFVDMQLQQNHRLVHSTMIGEIRNERWFEMYAKAFEPDANPTRSLLPTAR